MDWMPIETAPRDGQWIDVLTDAGRMTVYWNSESNDWAGSHTKVWPPGHWMPLPPPPNNVKVAKGESE